MGIRVRKATRSDSEYILGQLRLFAKFYGTKKSLFGTDDSARTGLLQLIDNHIVFVAEGVSGDAIVEPMGFIVGMLGPHMFNAEIKILSEVFWWVEEKYRTSSAGARLFSAFIKLGKEKADWISFSLAHNTPVNPDALLKRGFKLYETSFLREVS